MKAEPVYNQREGEYKVTLCKIEGNSIRITLGSLWERSGGGIVDVELSHV